MVDKTYPSHIFDKIRQEIATNYVMHEFRKLLPHIPESFWGEIDANISDWFNSAELAIPRDFWNGFHGISTGFKLKVGLIYFVTAENVSWERKFMSVSDSWFGIDLQQTRAVGEGRVSAKQMIEFYNNPANKAVKDKQLAYTLQVSGGTAPRDEHPIIVVQTKKDEELIYTTYDGNRRLAKAILEGSEKIEAFIGTFTDGKEPRNYWIPTTILMENLFFAKEAYDQGNKTLFGSYMAVLKDMLSRSESAKYEFTERALTNQQPFSDEVLKSLGLTG